MHIKGGIVGIADDIQKRSKSTKKNINFHKLVGSNEKVKDFSDKNVTQSKDPFVFDQPSTKEYEETVFSNKKRETNKNSRPNTQYPKRGNPVTKWVILLILILLSLIIYQNYSSIKEFVYFQFNIEDQSNIEEEDASEYENDYTTEDDSTAPDIQNGQNSAEQETVENTADTANSINYSTVSLSVLNGNGIQGSAQNIKTTLENAGFIVSNIGNALKFSYINTEVYYKSGKINEATEVKNCLNGRQTELFENNAVAGKYDVVVVVGSK